MIAGGITVFLTCIFVSVSESKGEGTKVKKKTALKTNNCYHVIRSTVKIKHLMILYFNKPHFQKRLCSLFHISNMKLFAKLVSNSSSLTPTSL